MYPKCYIKHTRDIGLLVPEKILKDIFYLQLCQLSFLAEQNHFGKGLYEEHLCEIILNLDQWFLRKCHLNTFLIYSSGNHLDWPPGTIWAILAEGIMRNISVKLD